LSERTGASSQIANKPKAFDQNMAISDEKFLKSPKGIMLSTNGDGSEAYIKLIAAELEMESLTSERLRGILADAGICHGLKNDVISQLIENPVIGEHVLIAAGDSPTPGKDAQLEYLFDTVAKREPKVDAQGRIDYKDLNFIQNAKAGQVLVRKAPVEPGTPGKSVLGKDIAPRSGRDRPIVRGANTHLAPDGLTLMSSIDGTIMFKGGSVSVQPSQNIPGSVDSSTGNINCVGSVKVYQNICSEFKVVVNGDLEVGGNIEDAFIEVTGNVLVRGGFFGSGKGVMVAGGDVTLKYAENQKIRAGGSIYVGGEVLNCDLYASDAVVVQGKMGRIAGGNVAAKHLVRVSSFGNDASVVTHVHVAYDLKLMERMREVTKELERLGSDEKRVKEALVGLYRLEMNGKLPADKKEVLLRFKDFMTQLPPQKEALKTEFEQLKQKMQELSGARVVAEDAVYAGTIIHFGPVYKEILEDIRNGMVFEKGGEAITRTTFDAERERRHEEQWHKSRKEAAASKRPEPVPA
jgi:uncharacterized protein